MFRRGLLLVLPLFLAMACRTVKLCPADKICIPRQDGIGCERCVTCPPKTKCELNIPCDPALTCKPEEPKKEEPKPDCACSNGLNLDAEQLALQERLQAYVNPDDRSKLVECITELRARAVANLRKDPPVSDCTKELSALEAIATADATRLSAQRNETAEALKSLTADDETLKDRLDDIKDSLRELEPVVTVTGTTVAQTENVYTAARAAALDSKKNDKAAKACVDRWAYVNIDISESHEPLLNCVKQLQAAIRKPTREETIVAESQFNLPLARMEQRLRGLARAKATKLKQLDAKHEAAVGTEKQDLDKEMTTIKKQLDDIRTVVLIPDESMYAEYAEYEQYFNKFFLGYEYVSLDDAFGKGFLRIGIMTGFHYPRLKVPSITGGNWYPGSAGVFQTFNVALTNTAESTKQDATLPKDSLIGEAQTGGQNETETPDPERALELEATLFAPFWRSDYHPEQPRLRNYVGPLVSVGAKFADTDNFATHRIYGGIRMAGSHEQYADIMYGRTFNLRSRRLEFRAQYPVIRLKNGTRITLGGIGNFGVSDEKKEIRVCTPPKDGQEEEQCHVERPGERDRLRIYVTWDVPVSSIFGAFVGK